MTRSTLHATMAALALVFTAADAVAGDRLSRADWRAKPADIARMRPQTPRRIVIHNTGVAQNARHDNARHDLATKMRNLQHFSVQERGWPDVPYHYYISMTGAVADGRDPAYAGDSNTRYDLSDRLQVVLEGEFDHERPSTAQLLALDALLLELRARHQIPVNALDAHLELAPTTCPGQALMAEMPRLRAGLPYRPAP